MVMIGSGYVDAIIFIILLVVVICFFRSLYNTVFFVAIVDIFLRILTFIKNNTFIEVKRFLSKYFPENIPHIISRYAKGDLYLVLVWIYVILMAIFLYYIIRYFIKKRKF